MPAGPAGGAELDSNEFVCEKRLACRLVPRVTGRVLASFASLWLVIGCAAPEPRERLNAPPQGESDRHHELAVYFDHHRDRGMLADMSIADIHFEPNSAEVSATGQARLERYAELLSGKGGSLRYETNLTDELLVEARLASARDFLSRSSLGDSRIEIGRGPSKKRGMEASEAQAGSAVAHQPEPRGTAYKLNATGGKK